MLGLKQNHPYYLECVHFDSELPRRGLTVPYSEQGGPVFCDVNYHNKNQQFFITPAIDGKHGYNFTAVDPKNNIYVGYLIPGARVVSTPDQKQEFLVRLLTHSNVYQIFVKIGDKEYAFHVMDASRPGYPREISLQPSDPTNTYQMWRFVPVNDTA